MRRLFPECEPGAIPPFGALYGQSVFADVAPASEPQIVFNAGAHTEAIAMRWRTLPRVSGQSSGSVLSLRPATSANSGCSTENKTEFDDALP
jgi:prolyl-tRNA editing enzyme YbaK/EbsC (Cys-tRNA(Pro) deacylase)